MMGKKVVWTIVVAVAAAIVIGLLVRAHRLRSISVRQSIAIEGTVIQRDADTNKQLPIVDVEITASDGVTALRRVSEVSGYFQLDLA